MSSPTIFSGRRTKLLTADGILTSVGRTIDFDGNINYVKNSNAEINTTGWATYADAAQATPVDGTGGSPNVTWTRSTTTPLRGQADFNFAKDAANRQGQGVSYDFTIDSADQGKVMNISFDYEVVSGTFASGDMTVWVYDVTNALLLNQPSGSSIIFNSTAFTGNATFQTPTNSTSYRLIFHVTTTSASAYTLAFDNVLVGPQRLAFGSASSSLGSSTTITIGAVTTPPTKGTIVTDSVRYHRDGQFMWAYYEYEHNNGSPAVGSGNYLFTIPGGFSIDTTLVTVNTATNTTPWRNSGGFFLYNAGGANQSEFGAVPYSATQFRLIGLIGGANNILGSASGGFNSANVSFGGWVKFPIVGWGAQTQVSTDANTRRITALITGDPASATSGNPIIVPTVSFDDAAGYNATTGRYTCPVPGVYKMYGALQSASAATTLTIYKNAVSTTLAGNLDSNGEATFCGSVLCIAGDIIDVRPGGTVDATSMALNIELTNGPAQIAASESINARYFASATSISGSLATISWTTKDYDTHNGMSAGTYTVPAPGKYMVTTAVQLSGTFILNNISTTEIQKNGTVVTREAVYAGGAITQMTGFASDVINCVAGDTLRVQVSNSGTGPAIISSNFANYMTVVRVGQ